VRTGLAISDPGGVIASPLEVIPSGDLSNYLSRLVDEEGVYEVVVGVPRTLSGKVGFQARKVLSRLETLRKEFPGVRFVEWDERFTTRLAGSCGTKKGTVRVDHLAAARMLQEYLGAREGL
jgi:putative holliday junction resolvase